MIGANKSQGLGFSTEKKKYKEVSRFRFNGIRIWSIKSLYQLDVYKTLDLSLHFENQEKQIREEKRN